MPLLLVELLAEKVAGAATRFAPFTAAISQRLVRARILPYAARTIPPTCTAYNSSVLSIPVLDLAAWDIVPSWPSRSGRHQLE